MDAAQFTVYARSRWHSGGLRRATSSASCAPIDSRGLEAGVGVAVAASVVAGLRPRLAAVRGVPGRGVRDRKSLRVAG